MSNNSFTTTLKSLPGGGWPKIYIAVILHPVEGPETEEPEPKMTLHPLRMYYVSGLVVAVSQLVGLA